MTRTKNFADVIRARMAADPVLAEAVEGEMLNAEIAAQVLAARRKAKLTQKQLAERVGTQQSVISRIEDADYDGHALNLLKRIARILGARLRVTLEIAQDSRTSPKLSVARQSSPEVAKPNRKTDKEGPSAPQPTIEKGKNPMQLKYLALSIADTRRESEAETSDSIEELKQWVEQKEFRDADIREMSTHKCVARRHNWKWRNYDPPSRL
jgi:transcriptional regulator with XRE-family HTH domain